ncbi:MAG: glycosyl hydrolase family 98 [Planctomycetaceae bacterium]|nr:glycosyl hydrolase family 98 [Planctomycetaceae bacterium]MBT7728813.1 glycosyl hydrolase family 98 [Planctomycetaceae bacterium]
MNYYSVHIVGLVLCSTLIAAGEALPSPLGDGMRSDIDAAGKILKAWQDKDEQYSKRLLHIVAWRCRDRDFPAGYRDRLQRTMLHIQDFYRNEMWRHGFGKRTFNLDTQSNGKLVIHEVVGANDWRDYQKSDGDKIKKECEPVLRRKGIRVNQETVMIFTNLAEWNSEKKIFFHKSPYYAGGDWRRGVAWQVDSEELDVINLVKEEPVIIDGEYGRISLGKHNSIFIGGIAHELGHALGLPHCRGDTDEVSDGTALMGSGNRTYAEEVRNEGPGTFLSRAHALRLASHPQFSNSTAKFGDTGKATFDDLTVVLGEDRDSFRVEGKVHGMPLIYGLVCYLDPDGRGDYDALATTAAPDQKGRFSIVCKDLKAGKSAIMRIVACHANGAATKIEFPYAVAEEGAADITVMKCLFQLKDFSKALAEQGVEAAREFVPQEKRISKYATAVLQGRVKNRKTVQLDSLVETVVSLPLSQAEPERAAVGWLRPTFDNLPRQNPWLESAGKLFETGIYAHAPSEYHYVLDKAWQRLRGECGLPSQRIGSVVFVIYTDGREVFRSPVVRPGKTESYDIDLTGVSEIILATEDAGDGKAGDWGVWLGPELSR